MKICELLEHSSANPFVGVVSNLDLRIKEIDTALNAHDAPLFAKSLKSSLTVFMKFLDSAAGWNIPEKKLRSEFHAALPLIKKHVAEALSSISDVNAAHKHLLTARKIAIERSHLQFGDIS